MYTQCPECATAFRVTAEILRQAAGKVRCGGCGNAFNALLYLSETRPEKPVRPGDEGVALPELRPEDEARDALSEQPPPRAASTAQNDALLETLDELAGQNIRFEDTGVEWRLLSAEEDGAGRTDVPVDADITGDTGEARVDELLEDSPTPIDEYLSASPSELDAPEVFAGDGSTPAGSVEASEVFDYAAGEMRFDDNTGLPDDFDLDADDLPAAPAPRPQSAQQPPAPDARPDGLKVDIEFGDAEEWQALLAELKDEPAPATELDDASPHDAGLAGRASAFDTTVDTGSQPLDLDAQFDLQAEALGISVRAEANRDEAASADKDEQGDADTQALHETDGDRDGVTVSVDGRHAGDATADKPDLPLSSDAGVADDGIAGREPDADDDFDPEPALHRSEPEPATGDEPPQADSDDESGALLVDEELYTPELEFELDESGISPADPAQDGDRPAPGAVEDAAQTAGGDDDAPAEDRDESPGESLDASLEALLRPDFDDIEGDEEAMPSAIHDLELELGGDAVLAADADDFDLIASDDREKPTILPMSEEEQTINQMIDEDMLRMAVEEDDGLTSSMVLRAEDVESALAEGAEAAAADEDDEESEGVGVETIIMEGEFIRTALEEEALKEQAAAEQEPADEDEKPEKQNRLVSALRQTMHGRTQESGAVDGTRRRHGLVAGIGVLTLLLAGQLIHQSRAQLATIPSLNGIIAPIYRAVGAPITPDWDVTGWRFEVTRGSTNAAALADELAEDGSGVDFGAAADGDPEVLTIYSRIGNQADKALPYPLVSVSLTDRFEEIIGSKVLSPNEYLTGDFDPRRFVPPGETFNAVITIESPDAAATGFKLNVCYREAGGQLRCAVEDFL